MKICPGIHDPDEPVLGCKMQRVLEKLDVVQHELQKTSLLINENAVKISVTGAQIDKIAESVSCLTKSVAVLQEQHSSRTDTLEDISERLKKVEKENHDDQWFRFIVGSIGAAIFTAIGGLATIFLSAHWDCIENLAKLLLKKVS